MCCSEHINVTIDSEPLDGVCALTSIAFVADRPFVPLPRRRCHGKSVFVSQGGPVFSMRKFKIQSGSAIACRKMNAEASSPSLPHHHRRSPRHLPGVTSLKFTPLNGQTDGGTEDRGSRTTRRRWGQNDAQCVA